MYKLCACPRLGIYCRITFNYAVPGSTTREVETQRNDVDSFKLFSPLKIFCKGFQIRASRALDDYWYTTFSLNSLA